MRSALYFSVFMIIKLDLGNPLCLVYLIFLGTPILPEDISTFYSLNFPNLSAVSATDCNIQVNLIQ